MATTEGSAAPISREDAQAREEAAEAMIQDDGARKAEELRILMAGFFTGITIAGVFLTYIVLEYAHVLG